MQTLFFKKVTHITVPILNQLDVTCILLDIDNTIKPYGGKELHEGVESWMNTVKDAGIQIILCSNNYKKNVKPFAERIHCDFISFSLKPSPFGYLRAKLKANTKHKNLLVVGDQVFTDIFGGKILHMKTALVNPIDEACEGKTVKLRRFLLKRITDRIKRHEYTTQKGE